MTKQITKTKKEIEKIFKELMKKYPLLNSLSCDIKSVEGNEFIFEYRGSEI